MAHYVDEPRYTIEQIDLLQRLRRSGMNKHDILHALDTMERLDSEHADKFSRRLSYGGTGGCNAGMSSGYATSYPAPSSSSLSTPGSVREPKPQYGSPTPSQSHGYDPSPPPCNPSTTNHGLPSGGDSGGERSSNGLASPRYHGNTSTPLLVPPIRCYGLEGMDDDADVEERVEELMRRDSAIVKEEIKTFLANRRISQAIVGQVTGISQSYISQWLLQHGLVMSEGKKRAFYRWYLLEKDNPGATLSMRPASGGQPEEPPDWRPQASGALRVRRGSRFTWRKECLTVMESYFNENQYPDETKREEIANACNVVIQKPAGKKLSDLERVTPLKVYNWFANRRKEIKRRANIGQWRCSNEAAILESHGLEVQSPGAHSNSDDVEGTEFLEQIHAMPLIKDPLFENGVDLAEECTATLLSCRCEAFPPWPGS
uniref:homeobox-containing protein 1 isoform X4 n=1 Tax=Myxine glutinosa TaxID=7769 RepID=UPI00358E13AA